jgi:predicted DNA-binding protein with PD1-like motif
VQTTLTNHAEVRSGKDDLRIYELVLEPGEEAIDKIGAFTLEEGLQLASFTAIGGFQDFTLGFFNLQTRGFDEIPVHEDQVEVLSLMGEITLWDDGTPRVHGHIVVGQRDGTTRGGHLLRGVVQPILIVTVHELSRHRAPDHHETPTTGGAV